MKAPMTTIAGLYDSPSSFHHSTSFLDNSAPNCPVLSPTEMQSDKNNLMLDMAVAADKTPFMCADKANQNLQRALNRFLVFNEREKKMKNRMFEQEERFYRKRVARCCTARPGNKLKTINTIEEEANEEVNETDNRWAITKAATMPNIPITRPKTAGTPMTMRRIKITPPEKEEAGDLTYTFNSLFGEVQKHVIVPSPGPYEEGSEEEEEEERTGEKRVEKKQERKDPLGSLTPPRRRSSNLSPFDSQALPQSPTVKSPVCRRATYSPGSSISSRSLKRCESTEVFIELERKRTASFSEQSSGGEGEGSVESQYVCENVFGNLSLQMYKDSRMDKITVGSNQDSEYRGRNTTNLPHGTESRRGSSGAESFTGSSGAASSPSSDDDEPAVPPLKQQPRKSSASEIAFQQLSRMRKCDPPNTTTSTVRRSSTCSDLYSSPSTNSNLTYTATTEPGLAVSKAVGFLERLDKYARSRRSKLHEDMLESMSASRSSG